MSPGEGRLTGILLIRERTEDRVRPRFDRRAGSHGPARRARHARSRRRPCLCRPRAHGHQSRSSRPAPGAGRVPGRLLFNVLAMVAEFESDLIRMRTREGMKVARAKGRLRGKQPKLSPTQEAHLVSLYAAGEHTIGELEESLLHHALDGLPCNL